MVDFIFVSVELVCRKVPEKKLSMIFWNMITRVTHRKINSSGAPLSLWANILIFRNLRLAIKIFGFWRLEISIIRTKKYYRGTKVLFLIKITAKMHCYSKNLISTRFDLVVSQKNRLYGWIEHPRLSKIPRKSTFWVLFLSFSP